MRDPLVLATTGVLAVAAPMLAARHLEQRVDALGPALTELTGEPSSIAGIEAGVTGEVRLTGVEIGDVLRVEAIEASLDEVRLERPVLAARVDGAGESNLARIMKRVAARRGGGRGGGRARTLRRIVVTEGDLVLEVVGLGRFEARDVELHPQRGGVRVVTGAVRGEITAGPFTIAASFARAGGDLALPDARLDRFLAVGGTVAAPLPVRGAALGWNVAAPGVLALRGEVDDRGAARPLSVTAWPAARAAHVRGEDVPLAWLAGLAPAGLGLDAARASGEVTLARTAAGWTIAGDAAIAGLVVDHGAIADRPVPVDGAVTARVATDRGVVTIDALTLTRGALRVDVHGRVRRGAGEIEVTVAEAPCLDLIAALPAAIRGPLATLVVEGRLGARARLAYDLDAPPGDGVELDVDLANGCAVLADPPAADVATLAGVADHPFPDGTRAPVGPGVGDWVPLTALPAYVDGAFVAAEDARFHDHPGFDLHQIARSLEVDLREGRFARGGSTISQQLVKNAFLDHRRTLDRKLQEAVLTWRLEQRLSKRQILERYLNVIELGPGVHGIGAAARHWFGKPARDLTVKEAAFLAAMTPEPRSMSRRLAEAGGLDARSAERVDTVLRHMRRAGVISEAERAAARGARLAFRTEALTGPRVSRRGAGSR